MSKKRDEIIVAIELLLSEVLNVENLNTWISVRERSITTMCASMGIQRYSSIIVEELESVGLIEREGARSGLRYKIISNVIPDVSSIAERIYEKKLNKNREHNSIKNSGYPYSDSSDLFPKHSKKEDISKMYKSKPKYLKGEAIMPRLGDLKFFIFRNQIIESRVISIYFDKKTQKKVRLDIEFIDPNRDSAEEEALLPDVIVDKYSQFRDLKINQLFETPEDAAASLLCNVIKFQKR